MKRNLFKLLLIMLLVTAVNVAYGKSNSKIFNKKITRNSERKNGKMEVKEKIYTEKSEGKELYKGSKQEIKGIVDGKEIGIIGHIDENGNFNLSITEEMPADKLSSRPGTDVLGGTLTTVPKISPWKNADDSLVLVYVSKDMGDYKKGWNYANRNHQKVENTDGYTWVILDGLK